MWRIGASGCLLWGFVNYNGKRLESTAERPIAISGTASVVSAADWDGDGRLDLLVGDYASQRTDLSGLTDEDKARHEEIRKELEPIDKRYVELAQQLHGPARVDSAEQRKLIREEFNEVSKRVRELRNKLPREYESHGWVWLFLRK